MNRRVGLVLLAGGRGSRFGGGKLAAPLAGRPVVTHVAAALAGLDLTARIVVAAPDVPDLPGFVRIALDPPDAPQSRSLALGLAALHAATADAPVDAVMVALADMPLVSPAHFARLLAAFDGNLLASRCGQQAMPPALFGARHFHALQALAGDRGAGALLRGAPAIDLGADEALDIDRVDDLARAERLLATRQASGCSAS